MSTRRQNVQVSVVAILNSVDDQRRKISGNVDSVISKSGLVENVGLEFEIASLYQAVEKLLPLPFLRPPSLISGRRTDRIFWGWPVGLPENWGWGGIDTPTRRVSTKAVIHYRLSCKSRLRVDSPVDSRMSTRRQNVQHCSVNHYDFWYTECPSVSIQCSRIWLSLILLTVRDWFTVATPRTLTWSWTWPRGFRISNDLWPWSTSKVSFIPMHVTNVKIVRNVPTIAPRPRMPSDKNVHHCPDKYKKPSCCCECRLMPRRSINILQENAIFMLVTLKWPHKRMTFDLGWPLRGQSHSGH